MTVPAVSIVVPCFNGGRFLDGLFASLGRQTFRDFETIIVDDGSTDEGTRKTLDSLARDIRIVRQGNRGLPAARNTGFAAARTDFVLPLDCDDEIEPAFLSKTVDALRNAPPEVAFVFTDIRLVGRMKGVLTRDLCPFDQLFINRLPYCMLFRKSAWRDVGGYDATMRDGYEDWDFNLRLIQDGFRGIKIAEPLFVYRVSRDGMLFSRSAHLHFRLWRRIRNCRPHLYRPAALRRLHAACKDPRPHIGLAAALSVLYAEKVLPDRVMNSIFYFGLRAKHALQRGRFKESSRHDV